MTVRHDPGERSAPDFDCRPLPWLQPALAKDEVETVGLQHGSELAAGGGRHFDRDIWMRRREAREDVGQATQITRVDTEPHGCVRRPRLHSLKDVVIEREQRAAALDERCPVRGQFDAAAFATRDQGAAHHSFKPLHLERYRRLGATNPFARARKTALLGDRYKRAQEVEIERRCRGHS
jgi:hypothetical protein